MTAYAVQGLVEAQRAGYRVERVAGAEGARGLVEQYRKWPRAIPDLKTYLVDVLAQAAASGALGASARDDETRFDFTSALGELWSARSRMTPYGQALLLQP